MLDAQPTAPCGCDSNTYHGAACRLAHPEIWELPTTMPTGVVIEAHAPMGAGIVTISTFGGISACKPDEARAVARALLVSANEAEILTREGVDA